MKISLRLLGCTLLLNICLGSLPISPNVYNLIDVTPKCYSQGYCDDFAWGSNRGYFPNSEERFQHILRNLFRMFANQSTNTSLGRLTSGASGSQTEYGTSAWCGTTYYYRKPLLWYSDSNQLARWKQWNWDNCDEETKNTFYYQNGHSMHEACPDVYNSENDYECSWFNDVDSSNSYHTCSLETRVKAFSGSDNAKMQTEGLWGSNAGYASSHCTPVFNSATDYVGIGFLEGMNDACQVFSKWMDSTAVHYPLPIGVHFTEEMRIPLIERNENGKYFHLMAEYYNRDDPICHMWALYDGSYHEMNVYLKEKRSPDEVYSGIFDLGNLDMPVDGCKPYAFVAQTNNGMYYRLPEDPDYYFGTAFVDWKWTQNTNNEYFNECHENHYYYDADGSEEWIVNGGPGLTDTSEIEYYQQQNECIGCAHIHELDCAYLCILSQFDEVTCRQCIHTTTTTTTTTQIPFNYDGDENNQSNQTMTTTQEIVSTMVPPETSYYTTYAYDSDDDDSSSSSSSSSDEDSDPEYDSN